MNRTLMRVGALAGAATLASVTAAPGYAATVSKATASAITIDVAGMDAGDSGTVTATNDGSGQQKSGMSEPPAPSVPSMGALDLGVLAQDARARVVNGNGRSAACAGIVGNDGSVLQVGEGFCLTPGDDAALDLGLGTLDPGELGLPEGGADEVEMLVGELIGQAQKRGSSDEEGLTDQSTINPDDITGQNSTDGSTEDSTEDSTEGSTDGSTDGSADGGDSDLRDQLKDGLSGGSGSGTKPSSTTSQGYTTQNASYQPAAAAEELPVGSEDLEPVMAAIGRALDQLDGPAGEFGISGSAGVIQAICSAGPGLSGDANLANAGFRAQGLGQEVGLLSLPANPAPNTHLSTNLSKVVDLIIADLRANLKTELGGEQLDDAVVQAKKQVIKEVVAQVEPQLAPLEENILDVTLNKQTRSNGTIHVTALDAQVLPAAADQLGASAASIQIGDVTCSGGSVPAQAQGGQAPAAPQAPAVPTVVTSGQPSSQDEGLPAGVIGGILALLGASALVGYRRAVGR